MGGIARRPPQLYELQWRLEKNIPETVLICLRIEVVMLCTTTVNNCSCKSAGDDHQNNLCAVAADQV